MFRNNFYGGRCEGRIQPLRCCLSKSLFLLIVSILLSGLSTLLERGQPEARLECCLATLSPMSMVLDVGDETKKGKEKTSHLAQTSCAFRQFDNIFRDGKFELHRVFPTWKLATKTVRHYCR
mgnify:CR=1 FL=1